MATFYVQTTGSATNSGSSDENASNLSGSAATGLGTSTIALDGSPNLAALPTSGATQATIYLNNATNSNQKIFKISAVDNTAKTVTVVGTPTGSDGGTWAIGGRLIWTPANIEAALAAGDTVVFNDSPAARASTFLTCRASGDSASGPITFKGKAGVRPVLNVTNTSIVLTGNSQTNWLFQNLEIDQDGASGNAVSGFGNGIVFDDVKIIDAGGEGINSAAFMILKGCEITGVGGVGINSSSGFALIGCNIHDCGSHGAVSSAASPHVFIAYSTIESNTGKGVSLSGAATTQGHNAVLLNNTIYGNGDSGLEVADADTVVVNINNIFSENGNAAGESNVEWAAGTGELHGVHANNIFFHSGGGGGTNLTNVTANSTELTTDPAMSDPAGANFAIGASSPAANAGYPGALLGGQTAYRDIGAMQRQVTTGTASNRISL